MQFVHNFFGIKDARLGDKAGRVWAMCMVIKGSKVYLAVPGRFCWHIDISRFKKSSNSLKIWNFIMNNSPSQPKIGISYFRKWKLRVCKKVTKQSLLWEEINQNLNFSKRGIIQNGISNFVSYYLICCRLKLNLKT